MMTQDHMDEYKGLGKEVEHLKKEASAIAAKIAAIYQRRDAMLDNCDHVAPDGTSMVIVAMNPNERICTHCVKVWDANGREV